MRCSCMLQFSQKMLRVIKLLKISLIPGHYQEKKILKMYIGHKRGEIRKKKPFSYTLDMPSTKYLPDTSVDSKSFNSSENMI